MVYEMKLNKDPFERIQAGIKKMEFRLYDEKRRKLQLGDTIKFSKLPEQKEIVEVEVIGLLHYPSFLELFQDISFEQIGYKDKSPEELTKAIRKIYTKEEEEKYGVLGIRVKRGKQ